MQFIDFAPLYWQHISKAYALRIHIIITNASSTKPPPPTPHELLLRVLAHLKGEGLGSSGQHFVRAATYIGADVGKHPCFLLRRPTGRMQPLL